LKHEVAGETRQVATHGLVEVAGSDAIHRGEITVEHHALAADQKDGLLNLRRRNGIRFVGHDE